MSIESEKQRLLQTVRDDLDRARKALGTVTGPRSGLLWALQYDRRPADLPLLRLLLDQELAEPRGPVPNADLELAAFLLAEHRRSEDVAAIVAAVQPEVPLEEWLADRKAKFPTDPAEENLASWSHHAARLGERETARLFLLGWADSVSRTERVLNMLQFHLANLGFLDEAIAAQQEAIAISVFQEPPAKISRLLTLARLQRRNHDFQDARRTLLAIEAALPYDKHGFEHPWRSFVKELFLLVPEAPDSATARRLLEAADQNLQDIPRLWKDEILDAAIAAAEHVGENLHHYEALQATAQRDRAYQL
jgi:hypothetical protein